MHLPPEQAPLAASSARTSSEVCLPHACGGQENSSAGSSRSCSKHGPVRQSGATVRRILRKPSIPFAGTSFRFFSKGQQFSRLASDISGRMGLLKMFGWRRIASNGVLRLLLGQASSPGCGFQVLGVTQGKNRSSTRTAPSGRNRRTRRPLAPSLSEGVTCMFIAFDKVQSHSHVRVIRKIPSGNLFYPYLENAWRPRSITSPYLRLAERYTHIRDNP